MTRFAFFRFNEFTCRALCFSLCSLYNEIKVAINAIKHSSYCIRSYVMVIFLLFSFAWSYAIDSHYTFIIHILCTYIGHLQETIMRITCGWAWFEFNVNLPNLLPMYYLICIRVDRPKITLTFSDCHQKFNVRSYKNQ